MSRDDEILIKKRSAFFITCAVFFTALTIVLSVLIPITLSQAIFFVVVNKSNYLEIANLFQKIEFTLQGNCISFIGGGQICRKLGFFEMFYKMPDFSKIPAKAQPADFPAIFQTIPGQNPYVFIILFIFELFLVATLATGAAAMRKTSRKMLIKVALMSGVCLTLAAIAIGISEKIYTDVVPNALNKPTTTQVFRDGVTMDVSGKPTDFGLRFNKSVGSEYILSILMLSIFNFVVTLRWIAEGTIPVRLRERIRVNI